MAQRQIVATPEAPKNNYFTLKGGNKNEVVKVEKKDLILLQAADNYVMLFLDKEGKLEKHMIRATLSQLVDQMDDPDILRVHRSHVINFSKAQSLEGKSPNYFVKMQVYPDSVPVSRSYYKSIRAKFNEKPL